VCNLRLRGKRLSTSKTRTKLRDQPVKVNRPTKSRIVAETRSNESIKRAVRKTSFERVYAAFTPVALSGTYIRNAS